MALIAVSGQPGCRFEELSRLLAQRLGYELVNELRLRALIQQEFGPDTRIEAKAYRYIVTSMIAGLATAHHLVFCAEGAEVIAAAFPGALRVYVIAPDSARVGSLMIDRRLDRPSARRLLQELEAAQRADRKQKFGKATTPAQLFDLVMNAEGLDIDHMVGLAETTAERLGLSDRGFLSAAAEAQMQFQIRLRLARYGVVPPGNVTLARKPFAHHSEQIFANLLDFYRIAWEYEPRTFPVRWDDNGKVIESFTPDFYLPEFDLYVELTTMKQSLVTRKNRKIRLLRDLYPGLNIQVFYQKDIENLIFKYGLADRTTV